MILPSAVKFAAHDGGDQDGLRTGGARLGDVAGHVFAEGSLGVGLAIRTLAGPVIVSELNQNVVRLAGQRGLPESLGAEAFGTPAVPGQVDHVHGGCERGAKAGAPASFVINGGIAHKHHSDGREGLLGGEA